MSITQNSKIRRITDSTLIVGADIAKKVHVARASDVRGSIVEQHKEQKSCLSGSFCILSKNAKF